MSQNRTSSIGTQKAGTTVSCAWLLSTAASDTQRERVLNVFVNFEQFKEDYEEFHNCLTDLKEKEKKYGIFGLFSEKLHLQ